MLRFVLASLLLAVASSSYGADCMDWVRHLELDHGVWYVPTPDGRKNEAFEYHQIPGTSVSLAFKKEMNWEVKSSNGRIEIQNEGFGYGLELKDGKCVNSYGWDRGMLDGKERRLNYDWKICADLLSILSTGRMREFDTISQNASPFASSQDSQSTKAFEKAFRGLDHEAKKRLAKLVSQASQSPYTKKDWTAESLYATCRRQTNFLASTLASGQEDRKVSKPGRVTE